MLEVSCERTRRVLMARFSGPLTLADLEGFAVIAMAVAGHDGQMPVIVDFTQGTSVELPLGIIKYIAAQPPIMGPEWCVFVASSPEFFGLARLFKAYQESAGHKDPHLVETLEEAFRFLKLETPTFEPYRGDPFAVCCVALPTDGVSHFDNLGSRGL